MLRWGIPAHPAVYFFFFMKPYSYYKTSSVSIPKRYDYMTIYYYRNGLMIGMKKQFDADFIPPEKCIDEQVFDKISYDAHVKHYREENLRLQQEFRKDLIAKYNMTGHPKADKLFDKAWEFAGSLGHPVVDEYFESLIDIIQDKVSISNFPNY